MHHFIQSVQSEVNDVSDEKSRLFVLPYAWQKGKKLIKSIKTTFKYNFPNNTISKIKQDHQLDVTYYVKCSEQTCRKDYIGETEKGLSEHRIVAATKILTY